MILVVRLVCSKCHSLEGIDTLGAPDMQQLTGSAGKRPLSKLLGMGHRVNPMAGDVLVVSHSARRQPVHQCQQTGPCARCGYPTLGYVPGGPCPACVLP